MKFPPGSPIGAIPEDYPHFDELLRKAWINLRDGTWSIVADPDLVPITQTQSSGKVVRNEKIRRQAGNSHQCFCMRLNFITHLGVHDRTVQLNIAIGKESHPKIEPIRHLEWRALNDFLAHEGVDGYQTKGPSLAEKTIPVFD